MFLLWRNQWSQREGKFQKTLDARSERDIARLEDSSSGKEVVERSRG